MARQIRFLREENRILRSKIPGRIRLSDEERRRLIRLGLPLGTALQGLISAVKPETFRRWLRGGRTPRPRRRPGPPRKPEEIRRLIAQIARESGFGYARIVGELIKLGITDVSKATVRRILIEEGVGPSPEGHRQTWGEFVRAHAETLWACDFFTKRVWTAVGPRTAHVLFFIHVGSRRVIVSRSTLHPTHAWSREQAGLFLRRTEEASLPKPEIMIRDGDGKFGRGFNAALREWGCRPKRIAPGVPRMNAFAERWVRSVKRECLDRFVCFGTGHLDHLVAEYVEHYHQERPHQGVGNRVIERERPPPGRGPVVCWTRLGGVLRSYARTAA